MAFAWLNRTSSNQLQAAATQASASNVNVDVSPGSIALALFQSVTGVCLWLQGIIVGVIGMTRAATSVGADLDSWTADFGFARLGAVASAGSVTFSRFTPAVQATIPVGALVSVGPGGTQFAVSADTTNSYFSSTANGYLLPPGAASTTVPAQCVTAGAAGNVQAGTITSFVAPIPYIDTVINGAPFANGVDAESDADVRTRFVLFVNSRTRGTPAAYAYAIASLQQGLTYKIQENVAPDGTTREGFVTITVDDGSGSPSSTLLASVYSAIDAVRAVGVSFAVLAPSVVNATISLTIAAAPGYSKSALVGPVAQAILAYIDGLTVGQALTYSRLAWVVYGVTGVGTVESLLVNGAAVDIGGGPTQVVRAVLANVAVN